MFTGVCGSGKSSLVFGTIAAESQRLINETYSAFVQGFMPTLARPEVDMLEGLTTAIIVDQERMGANSRSTVGTATDANAMLRILFSRLGAAASARPRVRLQRALGQGERRRSRSSAAGKTRTEKATFTSLAACARGARGRVRSATSTWTRALRRDKSLADGALTIPGYTMDGWTVRIYPEWGFVDPYKPIRESTSASCTTSCIGSRRRSGPRAST